MFRRQKIVIMACGLVTLFGCQVHQTTPLPPLNTTHFLTGSSDLAQTQWWRVFQSPELNGYIEQALKGNLKLAQAQALLVRSHALKQQVDANRWPELSGSLNSTKLFESNREYDSAGANIGLSWALDPFGQLAAQRNSERYQLAYQQAKFDQTQVAIIEGLMTTWSSIIMNQQNLFLIDNQIERTEMALQVIKRRYALGKNSVTDIWQQQRLLESLNIRKSNSQFQLNEQQLLLGQFLGKEQPEVVPIQAAPVLPSIEKTAITSDLLLRTPALKMALAQVQSSDWSVGSALANRYPSLSLRINYGDVVTKFSELFDAMTGSAVAQLSGTLFDGGRKAARVEANRAQLLADTQALKERWLNAITSTNVLLENQHKLEANLANYNTQLHLAQKTESTMSKKYLLGKVSFINLLRAQEAVLTIENSVVNANRLLLDNHIRLRSQLMGTAGDKQS